MKKFRVVGEISGKKISRSFNQTVNELMWKKDNYREFFFIFIKLEVGRGRVVPLSRKCGGGGGLQPCRALYCRYSNAVGLLQKKNFFPK